MVYNRLNLIPKRVTFMKKTMLSRIFVLFLTLVLLACPAYADQTCELEGHITAGNAMEMPVVFLVSQKGEKIMATVKPHLHEIGEMEYFFTAEAAPGWYNVVISGVCSGCPMVNTHLVKLEGGSQTLTVHPSRCTNEAIVLGPEGSVFALADGIYRYATAVCPDGYDIFSLTVKAQKEEESPNAAAIRAQAGEGRLDFYEISMNRQNAGGLFPIQDTTETGLVTLLLDYDPARLEQVTVWRCVDGKVEELLPEQLRVSAVYTEKENWHKGDSGLFLQLGKMGTYAIGYQDTVPATGAPVGVVSAMVGVSAAK